MSSQASVLGTPAPSRRNVSPKKGGDDPEAAMKMALIDLRCLFICISLLERVNSVSTHFSVPSREELMSVSALTGQLGIPWSFA